MLPQQHNSNVIERKFKRQIFMPDPIILGLINTVYNVTLAVALSFLVPGASGNVMDVKASVSPKPTKV